MFKMDYVIITVILCWIAWCISVGTYGIVIMGIPTFLMFDFLIWGIVRRAREKIYSSSGK